MKSVTPLLVEQHPKDYTGFPFITLIQYHTTPMLCIVDNIVNNTLRTFVLDLCAPQSVDEATIVASAQEWYDLHRHNYPISIHFSKTGLSAQTTKIYRSLNVDFVARAIGPVPKYPIVATGNAKRRKRKPLPPSVKVHDGSTVVLDSSVSLLRR